jgi:7-carboxy-7-deazaguanine synthase
LLYLQPEWGKRKVSMSLVVDYIMQNPKWKISLQTHKYLDIP